MAKRPWVNPQEVKDYTDYATVKKRDDDKLQTDIARAELAVITYTNNTFEGDETFPRIPESVKTAVILLAEAFGYQAALGEKRIIKSESFDDYSYTLQDGHISVDILDLGPLLEAFCITKPKNGVTMRFRKL